MQGSCHISFYFKKKKIHVIYRVGLLVAYHFYSLRYCTLHINEGDNPVFWTWSTNLWSLFFPCGALTKSLSNPAGHPAWVSYPTGPLSSPAGQTFFYQLEISTYQKKTS